MEQAKPCPEDKRSDKNGNGRTVTGRVDVWITALRANGIKNPHQVSLSGGKAEVPVAKVQPQQFGKSGFSTP
jgi:hypothetical protein